MKFMAVYICITITLMLPATTPANIRKPNLVSIKQNDKITSSTAKILPDERRQLSIFPKSSKRFMITPLPNEKLSQNPPTLLTRRPLMRKNILQNKRPNVNEKIKRTTRRPVMNTRFMSAKALNTFQRPIHDRSNVYEPDDNAEIVFKIKHDNFMDKDFSMNGAHTEERTTIVYPVNMGNYYSAYGNPESEENYYGGYRNAEKINNYYNGFDNPENMVNFYSGYDILFNTGKFYSEYSDTRPSKPITIIVDKIPKIEDYIFTPKIQPTEATTTESTIEIVDFVFIPDDIDRYNEYEKEDFIFRPNVKPTEAIRKDSNIKMKDLISIDDTINMIGNSNVKVVQSKGDSITVTSEKTNINIEDFVFIPKFKPTEAIQKETNLKIVQEAFPTTIKPTEPISQENIVEIENLATTTEAINEYLVTSTESYVSSPNNNSIDTNCEFNCTTKYGESYSSEEIADQNEFIFLDDAKEPKDPENVSFDSNLIDEVDMTTEWVIEPKKRIKRTINVIEEENLATTVSGFKFTVHDRKLANDMVFRNIHS